MIMTARPCSRVAANIGGRAAQLAGIDHDQHLLGVARQDLRRPPRG
ncbi:MAG: hypothetical protein WDM85_03000 [Caulobacteraceae bacterium]